MKINFYLERDFPLNTPIETVANALHDEIIKIVGSTLYRVLWFSYCLDQGKAAICYSRPARPSEVDSMYEYARAL